MGPNGPPMGPIDPMMPKTNDTRESNVQVTSTHLSDEDKVLYKPAPKRIRLRLIVDYSAGLVSQEQEIFDINSLLLKNRFQNQMMGPGGPMGAPAHLRMDVMKISIMNLFKRCGISLQGGHGPNGNPNAPVVTKFNDLSFYVANSSVNEGINHFHFIGSPEFNYEEMFKNLLFDYEFQDPNYISVFIHDNTNNVKEFAAK